MLKTIKETPLHIAATLKPRNDKICLWTEVLQLSFDRVAHDDFVNNDSKSLLDTAQSVEAHVIL